MSPLPSASSYALPAKYGGDVTTSATELFGTCVIDAELPTKMSSMSLCGSMSTESSRSGCVNRA